MPSAWKPRIGLVTDSDLHRHILQSLLQDAGYQVVMSYDSARLLALLDNYDEKLLDAWLIDMQTEQMELALDRLFDLAKIPLLVNEQIPDLQQASAHQEWGRRLLDKLEEETACQLEMPLPATDAPIALSAERIWVLAASLGGPDAVRRFLQALPEGLALAMVYAQHIDANFDAMLVSTVGRKNHYPMTLARGEMSLRQGQITVVPVDRQLRFLPFGRVVEIRKPWEGFYQPAIDQVIAELARLYKSKLGVIVFSGMCNDGEIGCRVARANGATVWAQRPETCASADMPEAVIGTGCVSLQGSPEELAQALVAHMADIQ